jgi:hypothetical protein
MFLKRQGLSWLAEELLASQEELFHEVLIFLQNLKFGKIYFNQTSWGFLEMESQVKKHANVKWETEMKGTERCCTAWSFKVVETNFFLNYEISDSGRVTSVSWIILDYVERKKKLASWLNLLQHELDLQYM